MMIIQLSESPWAWSQFCCKRCGPCPFYFAWLWCCVYNRVAVSLPNEDAWHALRAAQYPIVDLVVGSGGRVTGDIALPVMLHATQQQQQPLYQHPIEPVQKPITFEGQQEGQQAEGVVQVNTGRLTTY